MKKLLPVSAVPLMILMMMSNILLAQQDGVIDDPGDIAFVAYHDTPDGFSFVFLDNCPAGTVIQFTDKEWDGSVFNTGEGVDVWTNNTGGIIAQGTVVHIENADNNPIASVGTISEDESGFGTGVGIDQIYAVIGGTISGSDFLTPSAFLAFVGELNGGGTNDAVLTNTGLVLGTHAIDLGATEGFYSGDTDCNGTLTECLQMLNNLANWTTGGFNFPSIVPGSFGGSVLSGCDLLITSCPANPVNIDGCTAVDLSSILPYSTSTETISEAQFITEGGAISTSATITSISYQDVASGLLPTIVTRTFTVMDDCPTTATCTQVFTIDDNTPPTADALPAINVQCITDLPVADVNDITGETDNCNIVCEVWINEFHYNNTGDEVNEFIEVAGLTGINLNAYQIVLYDGADGDPYATIDLSGLIDAENTGFGALPFTHAGIHNGGTNPDGIALVKNGTEVIEFLSYEGSFSASSGPAAGMTSVDVGVIETSSTAVGSSIERVGTGNMGTNFAFANGAESPGSLNIGQTMTSCIDVVVSYDSESNNGGAGSPESPFIITRSYTLTDPSGNMSTITQILTAIDDTPPSIPCPTDINMSNDVGLCGALIDFTATASDNCNTPPTIIYSQGPGTIFPVGTTTVTAIATDVSGNSTTCSFNVIITSDLAVNLIGTSVNGMNDDGAILSNITGGTPPFTYEWTDSSGIVISTEQDITGIPVGTYCLQVTDSNGCSVIECTTIDRIDAVINLALAANIHISPNPVSNQLHVNFDFENNEAATLILYDMNGQAIFQTQKEKGNDKLQLDVSAFANGVYLLKIIVEEQVAVKKILMSK